MGHEINLDNYQIRTDLALEVIHNNKIKDGITTYVKEEDDITITTVEVAEEGSLLLNKKVGTYVTIEFRDVTDYENKERVKHAFAREIGQFMQKENLTKDDIVLTIGLGNAKSTPDALGPLSLSHILVTNHLYELASLEDGFSRVCAIEPGVMGVTGFETSSLIKSAIEAIKPSLVMVIDALASGSVERVNKTIQITDTGIHPGSGVGNHRKEISREVLGVPVIAIGVPTVVDAVTIVSDTIHYMQKHFSYTKNNIDNPYHKLVPFSKVNYLKKDIQPTEEEKTEFLGMVGSLEEADVRQLIYEVLSPIGYNLMVTPKEVDFVMEKLSDVIGNGLNMALHAKMRD